MNSKNKYSLKIDLSKIPSDIIPYISAHLTDCSVLDDSLRFLSERIIIYCISFIIKIYQKMQNNIINY